MRDIYCDNTYLDLNPTWHEEDSPWKASQVLRMIHKHRLQLQSVAEIGCGGGGILAHLQEQLGGPTEFFGFDIAPAAIAIARKKERDGLRFYEEDLLKTGKTFDLLLVMDVVEHVPDYLGFLDACRQRAASKIYHIPLDLHASSVLRGSFVSGRASIGHIHYFSAESAIASLKDTGHKVTDYFFTPGAFGLSKMHPSMKRTLGNIPRGILGLISTPLAARLVGGYSLLVLTQQDIS
jgi:SAM-dependent methyltransferase